VMHLEVFISADLSKRLVMLLSALVSIIAGLTRSHFVARPLFCF